ncbi:hypothetical protein [Methylobacterium sp. CCH5-D2]|uniref:hypothetical protein n=1 Tax=Methylobacterium sp. CCH5-D2 TaxID=1768765 RepID=UPI000832F447|nr:hypothetical protein [Methylobacterium sp. CCH5-D2]
MSQALAVILVCAASIAGPDCDRTNALDVMTQPVATVAECAHVGQTLAAETFGHPGEGRYLKIACERRKGQDHAAR